MTDKRSQDDLDASVASILVRGEFASTGDEDVDSLARLALGLRGLPDPDFKNRLGDELLPRTRVALGLFRQAARSNKSGWLSRNRPFAAAGAGYGLLAGACCTSGALAKVLGLASAAAISSYISSALPYYVAISVLGLVAWLIARVVHEQRLTVQSLMGTVARHGFAMASAYGAMFGASMALAAAMGLY